MTWTNRVVWQEGMFLRAQQFQQQDRHVDHLVRTALGAARPHAWGLTEMVIDPAPLAKGRFALAHASGFFEDGTAFALPGEADHPPPLELGEGARGAIVYLAVPGRQPGAAEMAGAANGSGRYAVRDFQAPDTHSASPEPAGFLIGRLRLCYLLGSDDCRGMLRLALARVKAVAADGRVTLDEDFIPPCVTSAAAAPLPALLSELALRLNRRGAALSGRLGAAPAVSADLLLLQSVNRWQNLVAHWAESPQLHPADLHAALVQMAGDFATFTAPTRRPGIYPPYRHGDMQHSFAPVIADLRQALARDTEQAVAAASLQNQPPGARAGSITGRACIRRASFVLSVRADMPAETLRRLFPAQAKIGPVERLRDLADVAEPGIGIRSLVVAPRQIPFRAGASYFELDRDSPHWQRMPVTGGFAIHVTGDFPNLRLELWAVTG